MSTHRVGRIGVDFVGTRVHIEFELQNDSVMRVRIGTCRTDRYRGGLPLIHSLNGFRLHQTAVYLGGQTQFGDIPWPREDLSTSFPELTEACSTAPHGAGRRARR